MKLKRLLSALLAFAMVLSVCPVAAFAATEPTVTWRQETVDEAAGVYKLVGHVQSASGVKSITTALNFDNNVIQPVECWESYNNTELENGVSSELPSPINALLKYTSRGQSKDYGWQWITYVKDTRTAVELTQYYESATTSMNTDADYMEFYFKVKDGQTLNSTTFQFASLASTDPIAILVLDAADNRWFHYDDWSKATDADSKTKLTQYSLTYTGSDSGKVDVNQSGGKDTSIYFKYEPGGSDANGSDAYSMPIDANTPKKGLHAQYIIPAEFFDAEHNNGTFAEQEGSLLTKLEYFFAGYHFHSETNLKSDYAKLQEVAQRMKTQLTMGKIRVKLGTTDKDYYHTGSGTSASQYFDDITGLTTVFEGSPYIVPYDHTADGGSGSSNDWVDVMVIELDEPFEYDGRNLVVDVEMLDGWDNCNYLSYARKTGSVNYKGFYYQSLRNSYANWRVGLGNDGYTKNWLPRARYTFAAADPITVNYDPDEVLTSDGTTPKSPTVSVYDNVNNKDLVEGADYTVSYSGTTADNKTYSGYTGPTAAGSYTMTLSFKNGYSGTKEIPFTVQPGFEVIVDVPTGLVYTGKALDAEIVVKDKYTTSLVKTEGKDYKLTVTKDGKEVTEFVDAGTYNVLVTELDGNNGSAIQNPGTAAATFTIAKAKNSVSLSIDDWTYGGLASTPVVTAAFGTPVVEYSKADSADYSTTVPTEAGDYFVRVKVADTQNYEGGEVQTQFKITPQNVNEQFMAGHENTVNNGSEKVNAYYDHRGTGSRVGHMQSIIPASQLAEMTGKDITSFTLYGVTSLESATNVKVLIGKTELSSIPADQYDFFSTENMTAGTCSVSGNNLVVTFEKPFAYNGENLVIDFSGENLIGQYSSAYQFYGAQTSNYQAFCYSTSSDAPSMLTAAPKVTFTYKGMENSAVTVTANADGLVSGANTKPTITVTDGTTPLAEGTDYTVTYVSTDDEGYNGSTPSNNAGEYKAVLAFQGNYTGTKEVPFTVARGNTDLTVTIEGWHVGTTANKPGIDTNSIGVQTVEYTVQGKESYSTTVPTDPGNYTVRVTVAATGTHSEAVKTADFTIEDHTEVTDAAVAATCTATGLTAGSHCSVCNTVIKAQIEIEALGHIPGDAATCTTAQVCTRNGCGEELAKALGHEDSNKNHVCDVCNTVVDEIHDLTPTTLNIGENQAAVYTATVHYSSGDETSLRLGSNEIFYLKDGVLKLCGSEVKQERGSTSYKDLTGDYTVKVTVNPSQKMLTVEVTDPNGVTLRRGLASLVGSSPYTITARAFEDSDVTVGEITYPSVSVESNGTGTGTDGDSVVKKLVTSFTDARYDRAFAWTARNSAATTVRYKTADSDWTEVLANWSSGSYYKADITGLKAGTTYTYQIGSGSTWSNEYSFTTAVEGVGQPGSFTFAVVSDTHTTSANAPYAYAAIQKAVGSNTAFLLHAGDIVDGNGNTGDWNNFFSALNNKGASIPVFATMGNHDINNPTTTGANSNFYFGLHFNNPANGYTSGSVTTQSGSALNTLVSDLSMKESFYSFDYGDAHFIVLNSGNYGQDDTSLLEAQEAWLKEDLAANKHAKWTIVMMHQTNYHRADTGSDRNALADVFENNGVDLVIQGHSHLVTRTYPMKNGQVVTSQNLDTVTRGNGTVYVTVGSTSLNHDPLGYVNSSAGMNIDTHKGNFATIVSSDSEQAAYTTVSVNGNSLTMTIRQLNGLVLDSFTISGSYTGATHTVAQDEAKSATCTEEGLTAGSHCSVCEDVFVKQQVVPALDHDWNEVTYNWSEDGKTCIASRVCKNDETHIEKVEAEITSAEKSPATCEGMGTTTYTATFDAEWAETQTKDEEDISANGHTGTTVDGQPETCVNDGWNAYYDCQNCDKFFSDEACENEIADLETWKTGDGKIEAHGLTATEAKPSTCTEAGNTAYWTCAKCEKYFSDANGETAIEKDSWIDPADDHTYGEAEYDWNDTTLTVTLTCDECVDGTEDKVLTDSNDGTVKSTTNGDCKTKATTIYTATVTLNGEPYTQEITIEGELGDHDYQNGSCTICDGEDPNAGIKTEDIFSNNTGTTTPATITAPEQGWVLNAENTFTVSCNKACVVAYTTDNGATYHRLKATASGDDYSFTVTLTAGMKFVVAIKGDVNKDGNINIFDVTNLSKVAAGTKELDADALIAAYVNSDDDINIFDVTNLSKVAAGTKSLSW